MSIREEQNCSCYALISCAPFFCLVTRLFMLLLICMMENMINSFDGFDKVKATHFTQLIQNDRCDVQPLFSLASRMPSFDLATNPPDLNIYATHSAYSILYAGNVLMSTSCSWWKVNWMWYIRQDKRRSCICSLYCIVLLVCRSHKVKTIANIILINLTEKSPPITSKAEWNERIGLQFDLHASPVWQHNEALQCTDRTSAAHADTSIDGLWCKHSALRVFSTFEIN